MRYDAEDVTPFLTGLKVIRKRRRVSLFVLIGLVLYMFLAYAVFTHVSRFLEQVFVVLAGTWFVLSAVFSVRWAFSRCPRCREFFYLTGWYGDTLSNKCLHCGLSMRSLRT